MAAAKKCVCLAVKTTFPFFVFVTKSLIPVTPPNLFDRANNALALLFRERLAKPTAKSKFANAQFHRDFIGINSFCSDKFLDIVVRKKSPHFKLNFTRVSFWSNYIAKVVVDFGKIL